MDKVDPFVWHAFDTAEWESANNVTPHPIHVVMRVKPGWNPNIHDFLKTGQLGPIVAGRAWSREMVRRMASDQLVERIEANRPGRIESQNARDLINAGTPTARFQGTPVAHGDGKGVTVAIIDADIDVLHEAFRDDPADDGSLRTRIFEVWDQNSHPSGTVSPPSSPTTCTYGSLFTQKDIEQALNAASGTGGTPGHPVPTTTRHGHGTHVTSIAAGRSTPRFVGGIAPAATILVVIPAAIDPASYIAALGFIEEHAQNPVVVNTSAGWQTGAHDGTSLLEAACDEFTKGGTEPGRVIVKSAGNRERIPVAGGAGQQTQELHAKFSMKQGSQKVLRWAIHKDHTSPDEIEVWFDSCDELEFKIRPPTGQPVTITRSTRLNNPVPIGNSNYSCSVTYDRYQIVNGDGLFALTIRPPHGGQHTVGEKWVLEIDGKHVRSTATVHAWLNGNDDNGLTFETFEEDEVALTTPGTARSVITVASVESTPPYRVHMKSSYGPTRDGRQKPEVAAPGVDIEGAATGTVNRRVTKSGTSQAAPHVTGAIALLLAAWQNQSSPNLRPLPLTANQIRAALTQTTFSPTRLWSWDDGFGVLNIEAFLQAFD